MKQLVRASCLAIIFLGVIILGACTSAQLQKAQSAAVKFQNDVTIACNVLQPAIAPWAPFFAANVAVTAFNTDVAMVCGGNLLVNLSSVDSVIRTTGQAAQSVVAQLPNLTREQATLIQSLIGAFQGSLKNAFDAYKANQPAAPVATSGVPS